MTNTEAIETLRANYPDAYYEQLREAVDVAIEVLKTQSIIKALKAQDATGDTINRQAAIDAANDWLLDCFKVEKQDRSCGLIRRLEDLPSAQPEQAIKDCRNCKFGKYNDHWNTNFCYCSDNCNNWDKWEALW